MQKIVASAKDALAGLLRDDMTIMFGGFGLCGMPEVLSDAVAESGVKGITAIANDCCIDGVCIGRLLENRQIKKVIASYVGDNNVFAAQYFAGDIEVELTPQGTLAERIRAAGAGIPAFFTRTGVGTVVAEGKTVQVFDGIEYVMERALRADLALVHAHTGDSRGNLIFRRTARNFNPVMATAADVTVVEVERLVEVGTLDPDHIHTPGVYVSRILHVPNPVKHLDRAKLLKREAV